MSRHPDYDDPDQAEAEQMRQDAEEGRAADHEMEMDRKIAEHHAAKSQEFASRHHVEPIQVIPCLVCETGRLVPHPESGEMVLCHGCDGEGYVVRAA